MNKETKKVRKGGKRKYIGKPILTPKNYFKIELDSEIDKICDGFSILINSALNKYICECKKSQREPDTSEFIEFLEEFEEELKRESRGFDNFCENLKERFTDEEEEVDYHVEES